MKDKTMSSRHDRHDSKRDSYRSSESNHNIESYKHVLKERHYRDDERNKKKDKDRSRDLKHISSHTHKRKRSHSPHKSSHHKPSTKSKAVIPDKNHRSHEYQDSDINESYEELSRRKRKLESELRALDREEAAAREAENKKICRDKLGKSLAKEVPEIKIKKEPFSDDEKDHKKSSNDKKINKRALNNERTSKKSSNDERTDRKTSKNSSNILKTEKEKHRRYVSDSSDDERGRSKPESKVTNKEKPNFATSGKLAEETNTYNGIVIKYNEPSEARKPKRRWRLYPFKGDSDLPFIPIHRQSAYLFGRTRLIADIPIDHPSCSKQHAVLQFRLVPYKRDDGTTGRRVRPYIIDLESSNGTFVNNNRIEPRCYVELIEKDVIKFGYSSREYVLLHEESKYNEEDDDVLEGESEAKT